MTMPSERTQAVLRTERFLLALRDPKKYPRVPKEFVSDFINVQIECIKDPVQYPYGKDGERSASYSGLLRSREIRFNRLRNTAVLKKFEASKYFVQLDTKRCGNNEDKLIAARDQGWITPEGVEIPMEDVLTSDFEIGHVIPYAEGGQTTRDNFVVQTKTDNRKLGMNPVQTA